MTYCSKRIILMFEVKFDVRTFLRSLWSFDPNKKISIFQYFFSRSHFQSRPRIFLCNESEKKFTLIFPNSFQGRTLRPQKVLYRVRTMARGKVWKSLGKSAKSESREFDVRLIAYCFNFFEFQINKF